MPLVKYAVSEGQRFSDCANLVVVTCYSCQMRYAIPESLYNSARAYPGSRPNGWKLSCPLGHQWFYTGRSIEQELEDAKNRAARERAGRDQAEASARAYRGHATRAKKKLAKVTAGVCPVDGCKRHFTNLERHIATKHPEHSASDPSG